ncbi:MAG TPA: HEAT repeat domain-containing protein [Polyangia bacterium]
MENPGPAQSLDEALLAALGEGNGQTGESSFVEGVGGQGDQREPRGKNQDAARRVAVLDALARGGSRGISALVSALRSNDDDVAMYAATALGEARDPAAVPHLIRLLQHPDLNVAQAAIDALGKLRAQSAASPIEAMLEADPWLRFAAAHALGEIAHPGSVHALMRAASDPAISELAIEALGKIATAPAAAVLADLLASRAASETFDGCLLALGTALGRMSDLSGLQSSRAWQRLASSESNAVHARLTAILVRHDVEPEGAVDQHFLKEAAIAVIRALAIPALYPALVEGAWDVAMGEPLLDAVLFAGTGTHACVLAGLGHTDADVRVFCCAAAAALGIEEADALCEGLLACDEVRVRVAALRALAGLVAERALPAMLKCLADTTEPVRVAAVRSLGTMDAKLVTAALLADPEVATARASLVLEVMRIAPCAAQREFVLGALADAREDVRRAAVSVLAANEQAEIIEMLEPLLVDPSVAVRAEVVQALGRRRSRRALRMLLDQFKRDEATRDQILRALGRIGDGWSARRLMVLFPEQEQSIRFAIIDALGAIAAPAAEPFLARLLVDAQPEVRSRAVVAIGQFASDGAVTRLVHATRDVDARVRLAALESLSAFAGRPAAVESFERLCLDPVPAIAALARRCLRKG